MRKASKIAGITLALAVLAPPAAAVAGPSAAPAGPASSSVCRVDFAAEQQQRLVTLTDTSTLTGIEDARARVGELVQRLTDAGDYRGTFAVVYQEILDKTIPALDDGTFADPAWARALSVHFVATYLDNFHRHLTGGQPTPYWQAYYDLTAQCDRSPGRIVSEGIATHLVVDFPQSLVAVDTKHSHLRDYVVYGESLVAAAPSIVERMRAVYGVDLEPFFQLWLVGDVFGQTQTTTALFQSVRAVAWANSIGLKSPLTRALTTAKIDGTWRAAGVVLDGLEAAHKI
ncbi:DUF5995 family protein [Rhodococcus sp. X156]|uniref:DUF5995 family protein n=1 Tax=Rhodococcus sp. X156 TaxID=2499145 RepID=UPI000FDBC5DF|nr:DUF5995 family protein [Rhodococcus sp. X156]